MEPVGSSLCWGTYQPTPQWMEYNGCLIQMRKPAPLWLASAYYNVHKFEHLQPLLGPWARHSPEFIHHPHQHKECVLAHSLLERVSKGRELLVCEGWVKVHRQDLHGMLLYPTPHQPHMILGTREWRLRSGK